MNTSGTTAGATAGAIAVNSGPLIIRTYNDLTTNNTFLLGPNDYPISTNRVLITSINGLLSPSDTISVSTINGSTMTCNTLLTNSTITCSTLSMFSSNVERIHLQSVGSTILNSGNVGIGTAIATYPVTLNTSNGYGFVQTVSSIAGSTIAIGTNIPLNGSSAQLGTITTHPLQFFTGNNTALPSVTVATSGKVGIGSTMPSQALDVTGSLNVTGTATITNIYSGKTVTGYIANGGTRDIDPVALFGTSSPVLLVSVYASSPQYYAVAMVYINGSTATAINQLMANGFSLTISSGMIRITNSTSTSYTTTVSVTSMG